MRAERLAIHPARMSPPLFSGRSHQSAHVLLATHTCQACWRCIEVCPSKALGRVNLPWHKHAVFRADVPCTGCLKCLKVCKTGALVRRSA